MNRSTVISTVLPSVALSVALTVAAMGYRNQQWQKKFTESVPTEIAGELYVNGKAYLFIGAKDEKITKQLVEVKPRNFVLFFKQTDPETRFIYNLVPKKN